MNMFRLTVHIHKLEHFKNIWYKITFLIIKKYPQKEKAVYNSRTGCYKRNDPRITKSSLKLKIRIVKQRFQESRK